MRKDDCLLLARKYVWIPVLAPETIGQLLEKKCPSGWKDKPKGEHFPVIIW